MNGSYSDLHGFGEEDRVVPPGGRVGTVSMLKSLNSSPLSPLCITKLYDKKKEKNSRNIFVAPKYEKIFLNKRKR